MESPADPVESLRELDRAVALPYIVYPRTTWWWGVTMGLARFDRLYDEAAERLSERVQVR